MVYVDDWQPGWVRAQLTDASGRVWDFVDKQTQFSRNLIGPTESFPIPAAIRCRVLEQSVDENGRPVVMIDTSEPDGVVSEDGRSTFEVDPSLLSDP